MEQLYSMQPPDKLRTQWREEAPRYRDGGVGREDWLMAKAAQWGADQRSDATKMVLSRAAQTVLDAATPALNNLDACGFNHQRYDRKAIAAALRAAADQVVPHADRAQRSMTHRLILNTCSSVRKKLLSIAAELEAAQ
jgi:hypothetical protein